MFFKAHAPSPAAKIAFAGETSNDSRCRRDNDFVKPVGDFVSREDQDRVSFVRWLKLAPPDLASFQA
jgi:hypothetical protein